MLHIGCHLSSAKGFLAMGKEAAAMNADTFAFFTRNPRGGKAKDIDPADVDAFLAFHREHNFVRLVAHAPYTMNLCAAKANILAFAAEMLADDLRRMEAIPGNYYNFHPGSHVGQGTEKGIELIAEHLNRAMFPEQTTMVLLETMAGKGSEVGSTFEELCAIMDRVTLRDKVGVCLDTCHVWDGGYDIATNLDGVLAEFDRIIGIDRLKAIHINDSLNPLGSHKDRHARIGEGCIGRHARIGEGCIGLSALSAVTKHPKLRELPFILETPNDNEGYAEEIALLRSRFRK